VSCKPDKFLCINIKQVSSTKRRVEMDIAIGISLIYNKNDRGPIAFLLDQNKSGFFGGVALFQPIRAFRKLFKLL